MVQNSKGSDAVVVTIFPDDNKKYLSTDLLRDEPIRDDFLAPQVKLLGFRAFKRVCHTCCDPDTCAEETPIDPEEEGAMLPGCIRRIQL